jgi:hypothetical protein
MRIYSIKASFTFTSGKSATVAAVRGLDLRMPYGLRNVW